MRDSGDVGLGAYCGLLGTLTFRIMHYLKCELKKEIKVTNDECAEKKKLFFFFCVFEIMIPELYSELGKYCPLVMTALMKHHNSMTTFESSNVRKKENSTIKKTCDNENIMSDDRSFGKKKLACGLGRVIFPEAGSVPDDNIKIGDNNTTEHHGSSISSENNGDKTEDEIGSEIGSENGDELESLHDIESLLKIIDSMNNNLPENQDKDRDEICYSTEGEEIWCNTEDEEEDDKCFVNNDDNDIEFDSGIKLIPLDQLPLVEIEIDFAGTGCEIYEMPSTDAGIILFILYW